MARLLDLYQKEIVSKLQKECNIKNKMAIPKILKITLNMGVGSANKNKNFIENSKKDLELIAGQAAKITRARACHSSFKIRTGFPIGVMVTLRRNKMYEFLDRLISVTLPSVRDFNGFSTSSFDGRGNFNLGIKEHISFAEIDYDLTDRIKGLDISIETSTDDDVKAEALLRAFNFPLRKKED